MRLADGYELMVVMGEVTPEGGTVITDMRPATVADLIEALKEEPDVLVIQGEITQERYFNDVEFATVIRRLMDIFDPPRRIDDEGEK